MNEYKSGSGTTPGRAKDEEMLWQQLMQQGNILQTAVTDSRKILDKMPGSLREDGINLLYKWLTDCRTKLLALAAEESEP